MPDGVNYRRFNPRACDKVYAVLTIYADQSFPSNETIVRQHGKNIANFKTIDHHVEHFTYPLFYPARTS